MKKRVILSSLIFSLMVLPLEAAEKPQTVQIKNRNPDARLEEIAQAMPALSGKAISPKEELSLWYREPAEQWIYALPIGNGRLGAMVYGGVNKEILQLNDDTLWSGKPIERDNPNAAKSLAKARELLFDFKYVEAQEFIEKNIMGTRIEKGLHSYQTLGDLVLTFPKKEKVSDYRRDLNLDNAIASVQYEADGVTYTREVFSSPVDQAIIMRITADKPGKISFEVELNRPADFRTMVESPNTLVMKGMARASEEIQEGRVPSADVGVEFCTRVKILNEGGKLSSSSDSISLKNANSATLVLVASTNYRGSDENVTSRDQLKQAAKKSFAKLKSEHIKEHQRLFQRVALDIGTTASAKLPTDERLNAVIEGGSDPQLLAIYFQYGRYLLICSSRPGTMPANL